MMKQLALSASFLILFFFSINANAVWNISTVDNDGDVGAYTSLALDSNNNPHISYFEYQGWSDNRDHGVVKYISASGGVWNTPVVVDQTDSTGHWISLAIDSNNYPHISYHDFGNKLLKYAHYNGNQWSIETGLGEVNLDGDYSSIAIDRDDNPHISFRRVDQDRVAYTKLFGAQWNLQTFDNPGRVTSLSLDNNENPHISYYFDDGVVQPYLIYAYFDIVANDWISMTVDLTAQGAWNSLALDSRGRPHISYRDVDNKHLKYAYYDGNWHIDTVDFLPVELGRFNSIAIDSTNSPHVAYYDVLNGSLKYAYRKAGRWYVEIVDDGEDRMGVGSWTSIKIDSNDRPHIAYFDSNNTALKYAVRTSCGANDFDCDGILDHNDNCPDAVNPDQLDVDGDQVGDACDNCASTHNTDQKDFNFDGIGDACDCQDGFWGTNEDGADCGGACGTACPSECVPVITRGDSDGKLDIVFLKPEGSNWATWRGDVLNMINNGYLADPKTYAHRRKINFAYSTKPIAITTDADGYCEFDSTSTSWRNGCTDKTFGVILHNLACINMSQGYLFSAPNNGYATVLHESAHSTFSLKDEYDDALRGCKTLYRQIDKFPNIYENESECKRLSLLPDDCRQFTTCYEDDPDGWWKANPNHTVLDEWMCHVAHSPFCNGWGADSERRIDWVFADKYNDPPPIETRKAIVAYFNYDGENLELYNSAVVYGDTPERFFEEDGLRLEFYDANNSVVNNFSIREPRYIHYDHPYGSKILDETKFSVVFPFKPNLKTLKVFDVKSSQFLSSVDFTTPIRAFCYAHRDDPECLTYDSDNDGVVDLSDNCPDIANPGQDDQNGNGVGDACDNIIIQACDTQIADRLFNGQSLTSGIENCETTTTSHSDYVSCVTRFTNDLVNAGVISISEKYAIQSCATPYSIGVHLGVATPSGNFNTNYDPDYSVGVKFDYHFTPQYSMLGLVGYHHFRSASPVVSDFHWWNTSFNLKYEFNVSQVTSFVNGGLGIYFPKSGSTQSGINIGLGVDYVLTPNWTLEFGGDYHQIFTIGPDTKFAVPYLGLIYRY